MPMQFNQFVRALMAGGGGVPDGFDIVAVIGQSNASGQGVYAGGTDIDNARVSQWDCNSGSGTYKTILDAEYPLQTTAGAMTAKISFAHSFANTYALRTGRRVLLVPTAVTATGLIAAGNSSWAAPSGTNYLATVARVNEAITAAQVLFPSSKFVGCIDIQGEADSSAAADYVAYLAAKEALVAALRANITGATSAWHVLGQMVPEAIVDNKFNNITLYAGTYPRINAMHYAIQGRIARIAVANGVSGNTTDRLHYNAAGCRLMGPLADAAVVVAETRGTLAAPSTPASAGVSLRADTSVEVWPPIPAGQPISDWIAEWSLAGADTWTVVSDGPGYLDPVIVTGLSAATAYDVRVKAANVAGESGYAQQTVTTPAAGISYPVFEYLTKMVRSGSGPFTHTDTANGANLAAAGRANRCNLKFPTNSASTLSGTFSRNTTGCIGLANLADDTHNSNYASCQYGVYDYNGGYYAVTAKALDVLDVATTWAAGDIVRIRRDDNGTTATIYAEIARVATPTSFTVVKTWATASRADLYPLISMAGLGNVSALTGTGLVAR